MSNIAKMIAIAKRFGGGGSGPSEVVILPETETTVDAESGQAPIITPLSATPTDGATAEITYNGTKYTSPIVHASEGGMDMYAMGNLTDAGIPGGGNPDAPFVVLLIPGGMDGSYGIVMTMDGAESVTLSIVQVGAASGGESAGGGIFEVSVPVTQHTSGSGHDFGEFDKTFAELVAAHNAGKYVRINVCWGIGYSTYGYVIGFGKSDGQDTFIVSMPASPTMPKQVAVYMLYAGDDGKIATEVMGGD